jgi:uridine kinase
MKRLPFFIAIAGGSASGKTLLARALRQAFLPRTSQIIAQDAYYQSISPEQLSRDDNHNFDHPDAIDWKLLQSQLNSLKQGKAVEMPQYCFATHRRTGHTTLPAAELLIYEGTLLLHDFNLRGQMNLKIFLDVAADVRLLRRVERDIKERGRSIESVIHQYRNTVRPMHLEFVQPSLIHASLILPDAPVEEWVEKVMACLPDAWRT